MVPATSAPVSVLTQTVGTSVAASTERNRLLNGVTRGDMIRSE